MISKNKELGKVIDIIVKNVLPVKIFLFGSHAKNTAKKESDFDIFVLVKNSKNTRQIEKDLYYQMAKEGISIPVDLNVDTVDKYKRLKENQYLIYNQIAKYGKTIYDRKTTIPALAMA